MVRRAYRMSGMDYLGISVHRLAKIAKRFRFITSEAGVTAIEYALIAMLIALVIVAGVTLIGTNLVPVFNKVATKLVT